MIGLANVRSDIAKGVLSAICLGAVIKGKVFLAPPWCYLIYLVPAAFCIWLVFLIRDSLRCRKGKQYASAYRCWQRSIIALFGFLIPFVMFLF